MREQLREGRFDERLVEIEVQQKNFPSLEIITGANVEEVGVNIKDMMPGLFQGRSKKKRVTVPEALAGAGRRAEADRHGAGRAHRGRSRAAGRHHLRGRDRQDCRARRRPRPEVSREGVQRDILPIIEGTTVNTKHGMVRTDHILFIAAGAFHVSKPSDLIPELQGRFPIRVELEALGQAEFVRILTEPRSALVKQYRR